MNNTHISELNRRLIVHLQDELDELRQRLGISERGSVLFRADASYADDDVVIVEADGLGGAVLMVVEGNYPLDYFTHNERTFLTESAAVERAETIVDSAVGS